MENETRNQELELAESAMMFKSEPFKRFMAEMRELVDEASEAMIGNMSSDPQVSYHLNLRWQQREAMFRSMVILSEQTIKAHEEELAQMQRDFETLSKGIE